MQNPADWLTVKAQLGLHRGKLTAKSALYIKVLYSTNTHLSVSQKSECEGKANSLNWKKK